MTQPSTTTRVEDDRTCCHATHDKVYTAAPDDGTEWEFYTITDDAPAAADPA